MINQCFKKDLDNKVDATGRLTFKWFSQKMQKYMLLYTFRTRQEVKR